MQARGLVTGGPEDNDTIELGLLLASSDRAAVDTVGVAIPRYHGKTPEVSRGMIFELEQIARAASLRVGVGSPDRVELAPLDERSHGAIETVQNTLDPQG